MWHIAEIYSGNKRRKYRMAGLAGPLAELKARLFLLRKIWGIEVAVLNEELAREYSLIC